MFQQVEMILGMEATFGHCCVEVEWALSPAK